MAKHRITIDLLHLHSDLSSIGTFQLNFATSLFSQGDEFQFDALIPTGYYHESLRYPNVVLHRLSASNALFTAHAIAKYIARQAPSCHIATFNLAPKLPKSVPLILQNHDFSHGQWDLTHSLNPLGRHYHRWHVRSIRRAALLLSNSTFTRQQTERYSFRHVPSFTIYHDCAPEFKTPAASPALLADVVPPLPGPYLVCAGRVRPPYKQVSVLLRAFRDLNLRFPVLKLVLVHSDSLSSADARFIRHNQLPVEDFWRAPRRTLLTLYRHAEMAVYPSRYEGFGAPILEAQNTGCPLIVNEFEPMREVAGNGAAYFSNSTESLVDVIEGLLDDPGRRGRLRELGYANAARFSWQTTGAQTLNAIRRTLL